MSGYGAILIDPPWDSRDFGSGIQGFKDWPYPTMRLSEIAKLPVSELAGDMSHLWMWTTNSTMPHACWLQQQWGFTHMNVITWVKESGWGFWWANCTEHLMFAYKRRLRMKTKLKLTAFHHPRSRIHSVKPETQFEYIEQISEGPYLEMFARRPREGWSSWGNEVESDIDLSAYVKS